MSGYRPSRGSVLAVLLPLSVLITLIISLPVAGIEVNDDGKVAVTFEFAPGGDPGVIFLAGTFNDWNSSKDMMEDTDGDGIYTITLRLDPGEYQYKFVKDDGWIEDPRGKDFIDDGYGGRNTLLIVRSGQSEMMAAKKDLPSEEVQETERKPATAGSGKTMVTFLFETGKGVSARISVAGTFNGWDQAADLMEDDDGDGVYTLRKELEPGEYQYKFVKDGTWLTDESALEFADDGHGGRNSVLTVTGSTEGLIVGMYENLPGDVDGAVVEGSGEGATAEKALKQVVFTFQPVISGVQDVFLAGTFNDWNESKDRMTDDDGDGIYQAVLLLPSGRYQYKFVVDGTWLTDENASDFTDDGFGGRNSIIDIDDSFESVNIEKGDGKMMTGDIPLTLDYSMVNPLSRERIEFRARAHRGDVENVELLYITGGDETSVAMREEESDPAFQYYGVVQNIDASQPVRFTFVFLDGGNYFFATPGGFVESMPAAEDMFEYSEEKLKPFYTPEWAKNGVFYQIFPDRFCNGDKSNDQKFTEPYYEGVNKLPASGKTNGEYFHFVEQWMNVGGLKKSPYRTDGKPDYYSFYGGDIAGVMEKIPYLADLGVTIIYFNPLNEARSNHKYDPMDYLKIDPHFSDEATFKKFTKTAHENGIRIIVDMAFNHTGDWHFAFVDSKEKGRESRYWNWYEWKRWPLPAGNVPNPIDYYDCWWGFGIHPNLNYDLSRPNAQENSIADISDAQPNEPLVEYILQVARYWLGDLDIDGFRLDVPNEVPMWFWKEFRAVVDEVKPDAFLIGEIWSNAMPWLGPHCFHSTMNYKFFRDPVLKFFGQGYGSATQLDHDLAPGRSIYPLQATQVMMNLLDSHDTERFITTAGNKDERLKLAVLFQMTYVGIPQIYYGDEVGLKGGSDPDCRRTFPWNWKEVERRRGLHDYYRKIIGIRHKYQALKTGRFLTVLAEQKLYSYLREDEVNSILVVLNNSSSTEKAGLDLARFGFEEGALFSDEIGGGEYAVKDGRLEISLDGMTGAVLVLK